jgi:quercetin dioxygenase-like cupin family protein
MRGQLPKWTSNLRWWTSVPKTLIVAPIEFLLFAFAAGEQLSEHTSARPAIIHILEGEGELTVGGDTHPARPGTWLRMAPDVKHSLVARTPMQMALYLLPR